jgi:hypothetical protein
MKTASRGQRVAIWFVASVALLPAGCQTDGQKWGDCNTRAVASVSPMLIERRRIEAYVRYLGQPSPFSFRVEDQTIGTDVHVLIGWLRGRGVTDVIFDSEYKLTSKGVHDLVNQISQSGIVVREFWIPRSTPPGRLDVLSRN